MNAARPRGLAVIAALLATPGLAHAINCSVTVTPLAFGIYTPGTTAPLDSVADISVRCVAQPGSYTVTIGAGISGNQLARTLSAGAGNLLSYNLFRDAARTQVWGDGTPPTFVVSGSRDRVGRPTVNVHPLYGRIYAGQMPDPGSYTDSVVVTVLF